ncbi:hypothetical protein PG988_016099 [Apiospora saccharicola]
MVNALLYEEPQYSLMRSQWLVAAVLKHLDPTEPRFACISVDDSHTRCFLTEACARLPVQSAQVLHVLLDNGADVHDGGFGPDTGALWASIRGQQPLDIVGKFLARNVPVSRSCALVVIRHADAAVARCVLDDKVEINSQVSVEECVEEAKKREDAEINAIVQSWARRRARGVKVAGLCYKG